jgi:hypothetical protein
MTVVKSNRFISFVPVIVRLNDCVSTKILTAVNSNNLTEILHLFIYLNV